MQVLKDEIRKKICEAALAEFKLKGYRKASMRAIAKRVGVTAGNLYRYFANKEDLFHAVISPAFERITVLIKENRDLDFVGGKRYQSHLEYAADRIAEILGEYQDELLILIDGSAGTRYEKAKDEIIIMFEENIGHLLSRTLPKGVAKDTQLIVHVIAASYIEGLVAIMRYYENSKEAVAAMAVFTSFLFEGYDRTKEQEI